MRVNNQNSNGASGSKPKIINIKVCKKNPDLSNIKASNYNNNKIGVRINSDNYGSNNGSALESRWEYLYNLEKLKKRKLEEQRKRKEEEKLVKDLQACTFQPRLNTNKSEGNLSIINRYKNWAQKKDLKLDKIKKLKEINECKECIFTPKVVSKHIY